MVALAAMTWIACSGEPPPGPALPTGWPDVLADEPDALGELVATGAEAWVGLHRSAPAPDGTGPAAHRAQAEEARVEQALAAAGAVAWRRLLVAWRAGPGVPADSALPALVALAQGETADGLPESAQRCVAAHAAATTPPGPEACPQPLVVEADGTRRFPDPLVHRTRARLRAPQGPPPGGLAGIVFSGAWSEADRTAEGGIHLDGPALAALGIDLRPGPDDDVDRARSHAAALDAALRAWTDANEDAPGAADIAELAVIPVYRSGVLSAAARAHLDAGQPHAATALLQRARDVQAPREVGPANRAELLALSAWAALATGRTREALDALAPLRSERPHVAGLISVVEDLAVLEGMRRAGDSKER